jgi:site-specific recombinase XerD
MNNLELQQRLNSYLAVKDALGFKTQIARLLLCDFLHFLEAQGIVGPISAQVALDWACQTATDRGSSGQARRLSFVRGFLSFLRTIEPETAVPEQRLLARAKRSTPYIFTPAQITQLLAEVAGLQPVDSLRPHRWQALIGLLASTGLRIGEAIRLQVEDLKLDADPAYLKVLATKFQKSRLVPLHPTTAAQLRQYLEKRRQFGYAASSTHFFITEQGNRLNRVVLWRTFKSVTQRLGMQPLAGGRRPTFHSLRHSFAVERLRQWYRAGVSVQEMLPHLSVYLGHVGPQESYWYLTATPELLSAAGERFQQYTQIGGAQ